MFNTNLDFLMWYLGKCVSVSALIADPLGTEMSCLLKRAWEFIGVGQGDPLKKSSLVVVAYIFPSPVFTAALNPTMIDREQYSTSADLGTVRNNASCIIPAVLNIFVFLYFCVPSPELVRSAHLAFQENSYQGFSE